uniref:CSON008513 protein n=1 Tax=Culicoides sonorensis TaxID=179676 RepID=A0A336MVV4_CULSO
MSIEKFDLAKVQQFFEESLFEEEDVKIDAYITAYLELYKFFTAMGSVFGFVSSDIKSKVDILEELRKTDIEKYFSVKSMMDHERDTDLLEKKHFVSGSRTLLRLHRGLDFLRDFLRRLSELDGEENTCAACRLAYNETLAHFHPWLIQKGALMAMYAMPTKNNLLNRVCADPEKAVLILPDMLQVTDQVYDRVHALYTVYDLHGLS